MNVPVICRMQHIIQKEIPVFLRALRHRCLRRIRLKIKGRCLFWSGGCFHRLLCLSLRLFLYQPGVFRFQNGSLCASVRFPHCSHIGTGSEQKQAACRQNHPSVSLHPDVCLISSGAFHRPLYPLCFLLLPAGNFLKSPLQLSTLTIIKHPFRGRKNR